MKDRHAPNSWDGYLTVHQSRIADFDGHFIVEDHLEVTLTRDVVSWSGHLTCVDGIEIHVEKRQRSWFRNGQRWVQTESYSYHALQREGSREVALFRYDNAPHHGHPDPHHRHSFHSDGEEAGPARWTGKARWPTLGDVIEEAYDAWRSTLRR